VNVEETDYYTYDVLEHSKALNFHIEFMYVIMIKSRRLRWAEYVARMGEKGHAYRILVGKPEGKRLVGKPRYRWMDNIKIDLTEREWGGTD
jgi:hypothetical protein